jgi:iron complex outermembrane recepter protein
MPVTGARRLRWNRGLLVSACASGLLWGGAALAADPAATGPAASADSTTVGELVITAEHRSTNLQTTAVAATVLTGTDLQTRGVNAEDMIQFATPSANIENSGQSSNLNIRGIGKSETASTTVVGVIIYRDGLATFPGFFQDEPFYDIASIEVLRGPQGTFQGQNATGGALIVNTNSPNFDGLHGYIEGQYGNYNDGLVRGAVNIPISDTFAARLAINDEYHDTFAKIAGNFTGDPGQLKESNTRLGLLWQPTPDLKISLKNEYSYIDQGGYIASPQTATTDPFSIGNNAHNAEIDQIFRSVLTADYMLKDGIDIRSISGYQYARGVVAEDADGTDGTGLTSFETFEDRAYENITSQELNVISPDAGFFRWIGGLYYQYDSTVIPPNGGFTDVVVPTSVFEHAFGFPASVYGTLSAAYARETMAAFGQGSFNLPDGLQIQAGLRYSHTREPSDVTSAVVDPLYGLIPGLPASAASTQFQVDNESAVTGKVALNWTVNDRNYLYGFIATGNKPGGANATSLTTLPPRIKPENVTDYEVGWKSTLLDGHLRTQLGVYYDRYDDFQVSIDSPTVSNTSLILNVPSTTVNYGVEASGDAVFGALKLNFSGSYLHSSLGTFFATDPRLAALISAGSCSTSVGPASPFTACTNLSGRPLSDAPTWTANIGAQYAFAVGSDATLTPRIDYGYVGAEWATLFENAAAGDLLAARSIFNADLTYARDTWTLTAYSTNLNNQHYVSQTNSGLRFPGAPRQYGLRLEKTF